MKSDREPGAKPGALAARSYQRAGVTRFGSCCRGHRCAFHTEL